MAHPLKKASDEEILQAYEELGSVWKVGDKFGMCGQSVYERLKRNYVKTDLNKFTEKDINEIKRFYKNKTPETKLRELVYILRRPLTSIVRKARELGLTCKKRKKSLLEGPKISKRMKKWHKKNPHPKGMLGKSHSTSARSQMSEKHKLISKLVTVDEWNERTKKSIETRRKNGNDKNVRGSWKSDWRTIGGNKRYFRSRWEANYARYLQFLKENNKISDWLHEPKTFWFDNIKRGVRSYLPDFQIIENNGTSYWVEVKGYMDERSLTKIKRFEKYYPEEKLYVVDGKWFKENSSTLKSICEGWEG